MSLPRPPWQVSFPGPPLTLSGPASPLSVSGPLPPFRVFGPPLPVTQSGQDQIGEQAIAAKDEQRERDGATQPAALRSRREAIGLRIGHDVLALLPRPALRGERGGVRGSIRELGDHGNTCTPHPPRARDIAEASLRRSLRTAADGGLCSPRRRGEVKNSNVWSRGSPRLRPLRPSRTSACPC